MPVKFSPSEVSREEVQVVLRASTSTSPDCSAVKRSFAVSATNFTLLASLKIAAASARQKSTSRPVQLPCASGRPKPPSVPLAPQLTMPRDLMVLSVWAEAAEAATAIAAARASLVTARFMTFSSLEELSWAAVAGAKNGRMPLVAQGSRALARRKSSPHELPRSPRMPYLRTIRQIGQGVDLSGGS